MEEKIKKIRDILVEVLKKYGVSKAAIFGSVARGDDTEDSDIDIIVEFVDGKSLLDLVALKLELQKMLGKEIDIITYNSIHPLLKEKILSEQVVIL